VSAQGGQVVLLLSTAAVLLAALAVERLRLDHYVWLRSTAAAYGMLGDYDEAIALLVRAMREGGPKAELTLEVIAAQQAKRVPEATPER
jgi:hypothetical protein